MDYAVSLGVQSTPAIAINGKLEFTSLPSAKKLRQALNYEAINFYQERFGVSRAVLPRVLSLVGSHLKSNRFSQRMGKAWGLRGMLRG